MTSRGKSKLAMAAVVLPLLMLLSIGITPVNAANDEGCWFEDQWVNHGVCAINDCWFWQAGVRCKDGLWVGDCNCAQMAE